MKKTAKTNPIATYVPLKTAYAKFKTEYRGLKDDMEAVKACLKEAKRLARKLAPRADRLTKMANKLYVEGKGGRKDPLYKDVPKMAEDLSYWADADYDLDTTIHSLFA